MYFNSSWTEMSFIGMMTNSLLEIWNLVWTKRQKRDYRDYNAFSYLLTLLQNSFSQISRDHWMILNWFFHQTLNHYFSYIGSKEKKMRKIWPLKVYSNLNSLMALSVEKMGLVTCYEFFIGLSKNWEWGGEMPYNRYVAVVFLSLIWFWPEWSTVT